MSTLYTYSTELMNNYMKATVMAPDRAFQALQTASGLSLLFCVGSEGVLYVVAERPGTATGWAKIPLGASLPGGRAGVRTFAVAQNPTTGAIDVAVAVGDGVASDQLFLCLGNSATDLGWLSTPQWLPAPYDDAVHPAPSRIAIQALFISASTDGQQMGVDILRDPTSAQPSILRYFLDPFLDPGKAITGQRWNIRDVPADFPAASVRTCLGRRAGDGVDGFYTLPAVGGNTVVFQPLYNPFDPNVPPNPARLMLPDGVTATALATIPAAQGATDLFVTAGSGLYYFPAAGQHDSAAAVALLSDAVFIDTRALFCFASAETITVLSLNRANQLVRTQCPAGQAGNGNAWSPPIPIVAGVEQASPYLNRTNNGDTVFLQTGNDTLRRATQSPETSTWRFEDILLPPLETAVTKRGNSYTTRIQASDAQKRPLAATAIRLSALTRCAVTINGVYTVLDEQPIPVTTDVLGCLVIVEWADGINGTPLRIHGDGSPVIAINPMDKPFKKMASLNTADALGGARITNPDGSQQPLVPPGQNRDALQAVAGALGALGEAYATLPADGSRAASPPHRAARLRGVAAATATGWEVVATVAVGAPPVRRMAVAAAVHPMSFGSAVVVGAGDLLDWLKSAANYVVHIVKETATSVWHFVAEIGGTLYSFVFDAINKVVASIESLLKAIRTAIEDIVRFLQFLFSWKDFQHTAQVVKKIVLFSLEIALDGLGDLKTKFDSIIADAKTKVDDWAAIKQDGWKPSVANSNNGLGYLQTVFDVGQVQTAPAMMLFDHLKPNIGNASGGWSGKVTPAQGVLSRAVAAIEDQGGLLADAVGRLRSELIDHSAYASMSLQDILAKVTAIIVDAFLNSAQSLIDVLIDALVMLGRSALQVLDAPIYIPIVSDILKEAFGISFSFSILDAIVLTAAIPATIGYKLLVGSAPFPAGDTFAENVLGARDLADLKHRFAASAAPALRPAAMVEGGAGGDSWTPIQSSVVPHRIFIMGHLVSGVAGLLAAAITPPSLLSDDAMAQQYETAVGVCGVVGGFSAGLATVFAAPCPIVNTHMSQLATWSTALTVAGKVGFAAAPYALNVSGVICKKVGSGFDTLVALLGMVSTSYHFWELSKTPVSVQRTEAFLEETGALTTALARCTTFAVRMDVEPVSKAVLVVAVAALTALSGGFQIAEAIAATAE